MCTHVSSTESPSLVQTLLKYRGPFTCPHTSQVQSPLHLSTHLSYTLRFPTGRQNFCTHLPWHRLNFLLAAFLSSLEREPGEGGNGPFVAGALLARALEARALVAGALVVVSVVEGALLAGAVPIGRLVSGVTSMVFCRSRLIPRELRLSLGLLASWLPESGEGTAGTGMNCRYGSDTTS